MAVSRYEKYVVRKPNVLGAGGLEVPIEKIQFRPDWPSTGPSVIMSRDLIKNSSAVIEFGLIWKDCVAGNGKPDNFAPHKHDVFDEIFCFLGTDYQNPNDLGAEAEFWMGEDETLEKIVINTPSCIYVPPGVGRWPMKWKNVKRPVIFVVLVPNFTEKSRSEPVSYKGRPMYQPK